MKMRIAISLFLLLVVSFYSQSTNAKSIIASPAAAIRTADRFSIGATLSNPNSLNLRLQKLIEVTAGGVSKGALQKFGGNFNTYWEATKSSRTGKVFEALYAHEINQRLLMAGHNPRMIPTAAEMGGKTHPADVLEIASNLRITKQYQLKLGWDAAGKAVLTPKYAGMNIITPCDQFKILKKELIKIEVKAARRGIELATKWKAIREAINDGRLAGASRTRVFYEQFAKSHFHKIWSDMASNATKTRVFRTASAVSNAKATKIFGSVAGKALFVVDVASAGYQTYRDMGRYRAGEIGGGYLATKSSMRGVQIGLGYYALVSPEPLTKSLTGLAVIVLVVSDEVGEQVHEARCTQARQLLESIDRGERYETAKRQLLGKIAKIPENSTE